jgi:two-component system, NtrC family, sensor kinase
LPLIYSDSPLLRQVFLNLLNNAIQAIGQDGVLTVITRTADNNQLLVQVNDTGCGIPKEHLAQIFDPFFTTKPQGKGTGLGLSICHGIVEKLGGRISVASEVGKGSSFTINLPQTISPKEM